MSSAIPYRPDIDGLRAIAVVAVLFFHAGVVGFSGGYVGVDMFFVISGFLISGIIIREVDEQTFSYMRFYERRVRRIVPALMVVLIASSILAYRFLLPADTFDFSTAVMSVVAFCSNFRFWWWSISYFGPKAGDSQLLHTWSLGVEEQFYITFPFCMVWLLRHYREAASKIIVVATIASFVLCASWVESWSAQAAFYLLPARMWELLLGTSIAMGSWHLSENALVRNIASIAAGLGIVISIVFFDTGTPFPGIAAAVPALSTAIFLDANRGKRSMAAVVLGVKPIVAVGLVSYSLYLWHWPLLAFARYAQPALSNLQIISILATCSACAVLSWYFVERPVRRASRQGLRYGTVIACWGAASALLFLFAIAGRINGGFPNRYLPLTLAYLHGIIERDPDTARCVDAKLSLSPHDGLCRFGPPTSATTADLLVWGDSHANALMPVLKVLAAERGVTGLIATRSGCFPVLGLDRVDRGAACREFNDSVFSLIRAGAIHTVVLAAFWGRSTPDPILNAEFGQVLLRRSAEETPSAEESKAAFKSAFVSTIARLRSLGVRTYIIADVPVYARLMRRIASAAEGGQDVSKLGANRAVYRTHRLELDSLFARLVDEGHATVLDPFDILCSTKRCTIVANGRSLYRDNHHLTVSGAMTLKSLFTPLFEAVAEHEMGPLNNK